MTKFMNEVWARVGTKPGDALYIPEFDVNKDGIIDATDYKMIRNAISQGDALIVDDMEKVIRDHQSSKLSPPEKKIPNFDLNNDGAVNSTDQLIMRNIWIISLDSYTPAMTKFMSEVSTRYSGISDPRYIPEFDVNKDGLINDVDYLKIQKALSRGRT